VQPARRCRLRKTDRKARPRRWGTTPRRVPWDDEPHGLLLCLSLPPPSWRAAQAAQQAAQRHAAEVAAARRAAAARQPRQPTVHAASVGAASVSGLGACGGDLPPCFVKKRESKGDYRIWNGGCYAPIGWQGSRSPCGGSTASGAWQILRSTWAGFDGYINAADAPPEVQDAKARLLWAGGRGCTHWSAC
jgi:hypothetical protein